MRESDGPMAKGRAGKERPTGLRRTGRQAGPERQGMRESDGPMAKGRPGKERPGETGRRKKENRAFANLCLPGRNCGPVFKRGSPGKRGAGMKKDAAMRVEDLLIDGGTSVLDAMQRLGETGAGILFLCENSVLRGCVTDGDIRRYILKGLPLEGPVYDAANRSPCALPIESRAQARAALLEKGVSALPLLDKKGRVQDVVFADDFLDVVPYKKLDVPVVMMAGGLGTRLYPYTKILPKPLIPIGELPIAEHIINRFTDVGCDSFTMIVNYKKSMIKSYFNDLQKDYTVTYADEDAPLGTGGGLSLLKGRITRTFFLTNCDILIDADLADLYQAHREQGNTITMVCAVKHFTIPYGVVELGDGGELSAISEKPEMNFLTNTGLYVAEPSVIEGLRPNEPIPFTDVIENVRASGGRVGVYPVSEHSWMDMGQLEELDNMRRRLEMP